MNDTTITAKTAVIKKTDLMDFSLNRARRAVSEAVFPVVFRRSEMVRRLPVLNN